MFALILLAVSSVHGASAPGPPVSSIAEAIRTTKNGAVIHDRQTVTVEGVASVGTGAFYGPRPQRVFIQDDAAGIALFSHEAKWVIHAGDQIRATGTLQSYGGALEVDASDLRVIGRAAPPEPIAVRPVDLLGPKYSGRLVQITAAVVESTPANGKALNVGLKAGDKLLILHLTEWQLRRLPRPKLLFEDGTTLLITGIASQYAAKPPYDTGWQILPRTVDDIALVREAPILTIREVLLGVGSVTVIIIACVAAVILLRHQVRRERRRVADSEARYRTLFERSVAGLYTTTVRGKIIDCNDAVARLLGCTREEVIGRQVRDYYADPQQLASVVQVLRERGEVADLEIALRRSDGTIVWALATATTIETAGNEPVIDGAVIDISDRRRAIEQIEFMAYHDAMTGLPNRALFRDRLDLQIAQAQRDSVPIAVLFLDLDRFKRINDSLGHSAGDEILKGVAARLHEAIRAGDTVARFGGDEFAILARVSSVDAAETVARKALSVIQQPFGDGDRVLHITASIGVAIHPADGSDCETLLKNADLAMYRAKDAGRNTVQFVSTTADAGRALSRLSLENDLRRALQGRMLEVWFQPMVSAITGQIVGAEALARWRDPRRGYVDPAEFVSIAEEIGVIDSLGDWVLEEACRVGRSWQQYDLDPGFRISVNVSAYQLRDEHFPEKVSAILSEAGIPPSMIELEVTESAALSKLPHTLPAFARLRALGLGISIDDFGTGHSTFTNVRQLPVTTIKIDASFIARVVTDTNDATIVASIIDMSHRLSCRVVAEGVESIGQLEFLRGQLCEAYQGFLFSAAVPASEFEQFLLAPRGVPQPSALATGL